MTLPKIGFNEGSLLRRTALHVGTFLLGSVAFVGIVSLLLVSIAKGLVAPRSEGTADEPEVGVAATAGPRAPRAPAVRVNKGKRSAGKAPAAKDE